MSINTAELRSLHQGLPRPLLPATIGDIRWPRKFNLFGVYVSALTCEEGCNAVIEGKDEAEVMAKGAEHAKTAHKMTTIPPDVAAKVKAAIKDKK